VHQDFVAAVDQPVDPLGREGAVFVRLFPFEIGRRRVEMSGARTSATTVDG
jgi:hypothetical protein